MNSQTTFTVGKFVSPSHPFKQSFPVVTSSGNSIGRWLCCTLAVLVLATPNLSASSAVQQFNLKGLCDRSDRILRATVLDVTQGTVRAGGGDIPAVTYRLKVSEALAGGASAVLDIKMIGSVKADASKGSIRRHSMFDDVPKLEKGREYVLFTTKPSAAGLCTTVGLAQGCFNIVTQNKSDYAVNGLNNRGLGLPSAGPVAYTELARRIRELRATAP
jgi:hypothetical protein